MGTAACLTWLPPHVFTPMEREESYGTFENRTITRITGHSGKSKYCVEDSSGNFLFYIPLKNCLIDSRFRNGKLRFRDLSSGKEGYVDSTGFLTFLPDKPSDVIVAAPAVTPDTAAPKQTVKRMAATHLRETDIRSMLSNHPYRNEAAKVLSGRLEVTDSLRRRRILNYCEHFRMAYDSKDIDFLRQVFSDNALIIVGHTVRTGKGSDKEMAGNEKVRYSIRSKHEYLDRLAAIFDSNKKIRVGFSDFHIMRHPTLDGIYGVSLRQKYACDSYSDEGYLFLLWDFRDDSMPKIHVRTWQPERVLTQGEEPIEMSDFNLD